MGGGGPLADVDLGVEEEQSLLSLEVSEPLFMLLLSWLVLSHRRSEQSKAGDAALALGSRLSRFKNRASKARVKHNINIGIPVLDLIMIIPG